LLAACGELLAFMALAVTVSFAELALLADGREAFLVLVAEELALAVRAAGRALGPFGFAAQVVVAEAQKTVLVLDAARA